MTVSCIRTRSNCLLSAIKFYRSYKADGYTPYLCYREYHFFVLVMCERYYYAADFLSTPRFRSKLLHFIYMMIPRVGVEKIQKLEY